MILSRKKITLEYTVIQCMSCAMTQKRRFSTGDILFAELSRCDSCGAKTRVEKIFGQSFDQ